MTYNQQQDVQTKSSKDCRFIPAIMGSIHVDFEEDISKQLDLRCALRMCILDSSNKVLRKIHNKIQQMQIRMFVVNISAL